MLSEKNERINGLVHSGQKIEVGNTEKVAGGGIPPAKIAWMPRI